MNLTNKCAKCGCEDSFLTTPPPCPAPEACPTPEACSNVTEAQCTIYTGPPIMCGQTIVVDTNTDIATALQAIVSLYCQL